jgi:hypothetical protein
MSLTYIIVWLLVGVGGTLLASYGFLWLAGVIHSWPYDMTFHTHGR